MLHGCRQVAGAIVATLSMAGSVGAQQLAARQLTVADGLGHDDVHDIYQDSRGYVWIATYDGLSRFDGERIVTFGLKDGLTHPIVGSVAEDSAGRLWAASPSGGLARLTDSRGVTAFVREPPGQPRAVEAVLPASDGSVWTVAADGIYRMTSRAGRFSFERIQATGESFFQTTVLRDARGRLWFAIDRQLVLVVDGAPAAFWTKADRIATTRICALAEDRAGRILAANQEEVFELVESGSSRSWRPVPVPRASDESFSALHIDRTGRLWIGTSRRLLAADPGAEAAPVSLPGLRGGVTRLYEDREGNVWIGTGGSGAFIIGAEHVESFTTAEGLPSNAIRLVAEGPRGQIYVSTDGGVVQIVNGRAVRVPGGDSSLAKEVGTRLRLDRHGDWWMGGHDALYRSRSSALRFDHPESVLAGLVVPPGEWFGPMPYEDASGRMWATGPAGSIYSIDRGPAGRTHPVEIPLSTAAVRLGRIAVDHRGDVWVGSYGYLMRRRPGGRVDAISAAPGLPETLVRSLLVDSRGWLWIGLRYGGVSVARDPAADRPAFENYSTASGLASDSVWTLCEDREGHVYFGTGRGLDRLDPRGGSIRHYAPQRDLAGAVVNGCMQDRSGYLWVATMTGLWRFVPNAVRPSTAPDVYFTRVRVAGEELPLAPRGDSLVAAPPIDAPAGDMLVEFTAPAASRAVQYQYRLDGMDDAWSPPRPQRSLNLARLAAGSYHLRLRAITEDGQVSARAASLDLRVLPVFWQRWWFLLLAGCAAAAAMVGAHRLRVRHILAVERVRRQVALDLHDDVGAGLTQIAMLSELALRQPQATGARLMGDVAQTARQLRESMSDIVWAIDPRRDHLADLVDRVRDIAYQMLAADGISVNIVAPPDAEATLVALDAVRRRQILLVVKEALANVARHARASAVRIEMRLSRGGLSVLVADNGLGFPAAAVRAGHGLQSMRARAAALGGSCSVVSTPGTGTSLEMVVPL